jgi:hypothetical protein|tara:strand:+ start:902 stop:1486 length:585 start_codon:yes stop_codon:yes gene_type:complete
MHKFILVKTLFLLCFLAIIQSSCGIYKYSDAKKNPTNADDRIKENMESGKGFRLGSIGKKNSGEFMFASSNPLWRASIEKLDFAPLNNVDYAGGIIVTDWFNDGNSNEQIKITIRFLSNEIRSDALDVIIHKKICKKDLMSCDVSKIDNSLNSEIRYAILKKASQIQNMDQASKKEKSGEYIIRDTGRKKKKKK